MPSAFHRWREWLRESEALPTEIAKDIGDNFTPAERRRALALASQHGALSGLTLGLPFLALFVSIVMSQGWLLPCLMLIPIGLLDGYLYVRFKRKFRAFMLSTSRSREKGYSERLAQRPQLDGNSRT